MGYPVIAAVTKAVQNSNATPSITLPSGIVAGDLIVIVGGAKYSISITWTSAPAGFTVANSDDATPNFTIIAWKRAVGTEGGTSVTFGLSSSSGYCVLTALRITGVSSTATPIVAGANFTIVEQLYYDCPSISDSFIARKKLVIAASRIGYGNATSPDAPTGYSDAAPGGGNLHNSAGAGDTITLILFSKNVDDVSTHDPAQANHNSPNGIEYSYSNTLVIEGVDDGALFWAFP